MFGRDRSARTKKSSPSREESSHNFSRDMTKLCILTLALLLALPCRAEAARPAAVTPQQVDEIVDHLLSGLGDYVFPEVAEKLQSQIRAHRSEYRAVSDSNALAARLTEDLRAVGHDNHLLWLLMLLMSVRELGAASTAV
jgi:hypothetical protein